MNVKGGGLDLKVECHPTKEEFKGATSEVNYGDWTNFKGKAQQPNGGDGC